MSSRRANISGYVSPALQRAQVAVFKLCMLLTFTVGLFAFSQKPKQLIPFPYLFKSRLLLTIFHADMRIGHEQQWRSGKFGAGGTLGGLGAEHGPAGPGAEPLVGGSGGRSPSEAESFFCFWISQGRGHFYLTSKFRELRKLHIFQVTSD